MPRHRAPREHWLFSRAERILLLQLAGVAGVLIALALWFGVQLDHVVDAQDGDGGFGGELQRLDFRHSGLQHAGREVVAERALGEVQTHPLEVRVFNLWVVGDDKYLFITRFRSFNSRLLKYIKETLHFFSNLVTRP